MERKRWGGKKAEYQLSSWEVRSEEESEVGTEVKRVRNKPEEGVPKGEWMDSIEGGSYQAWPQIVRLNCSVAKSGSHTDVYRLWI